MARFFDESSGIRVAKSGELCSGAWNRRRGRHSFSPLSTCIRMREPWPHKSDCPRSMTEPGTSEAVYRHESLFDGMSDALVGKFRGDRCHDSPGRPRADMSRRSRSRRRAGAPASRRAVSRVQAAQGELGWEVLFRAIPRKCLQQQSCLDPNGCSFMGDNNVVVDVFVRDRQTGTIEQAPRTR
jgi:hypothetical protein